VGAPAWPTRGHAGADRQLASDERLARTCRAARLGRSKSVEQQCLRAANPCRGFGRPGPAHPCRGGRGAEIPRMPTSSPMMTTMLGAAGRPQQVAAPLVCLLRFLPGLSDRQAESAEAATRRAAAQHRSRRFNPAPVGPGDHLRLFLETLIVTHDVILFPGDAPEADMGLPRCRSARHDARRAGLIRRRAVVGRRRGCEPPFKHLARES